MNQLIKSRLGWLLCAVCYPLVVGGFPQQVGAEDFPRKSATLRRLDWQSEGSDKREVGSSISRPLVADKTRTLGEQLIVAPKDAEQPMQLAQVRRRRPGSEEPRRRERRDAPEESIPAATTVQEAERKREEIYQNLPSEKPIPPTGDEFITTPDRWTMIYKGRWYDPYNQNILKGDLRLFGDYGEPWFLELTGISDSLYERRGVPTPVGLQSTNDAEDTDVFGDFEQDFFNQNLIFEVALIKGNTTFKPQDLEFRIAPIVNFNHVNLAEVGGVRADPARGTHRDDAHVTLLEAFVDYHLADISDRYDFISSRWGIQRFQSDFRGFIYADEQPGVRFFGNWDNNKWQYNLAYFHRLEKDANALLNKLFESRKENVVIANVYHQDIPVLGNTVQLNFIYHDDTFGDDGSNFDENNFLTVPSPIGTERPNNLYTYYTGFTSDGHFGRLNVNSALYWVTGSEKHNPIAGRGVDINAYMAALELSVDIDFIRPKASFFWASGDDDAFDSDAEGFDAIFDNPVFAGGDNTYWQRQGIPLIAGGGVALTDRLSLLADLRAGKPQGQSNFVNPGIRIYNVGVDIDVLPELILENNVNYLQFDQTDVLETVRQDGSIDREIGWDLSTAVLYRPFLNNNVQLRAGYAALLPGDGLENLYGDRTLYQFFTNLILLY
ncbi:MAG: hypothetical protein KDD69_04290 [Bdellovibrionales bacterium]|nr:hypothetical protein [Bdellovibrionales bacterium]